VAVGSPVDDLIDLALVQVPSGGGAVAAAPSSGGGAAPAAETKEEEKKEEKVRTLISAYGPGPHLTPFPPRRRKSPTMIWASACSIRLQLYRCNVPSAFASIFRCTLVSA
jgi:hypothetical protein